MVKSLGRCAGGCISDGQSYETDSGQIFVKYNVDKKVGVASSLFLHTVLITILQAKVMFDGERASLEAILQTNTVHVPKPIKV